MRIGYLTYGLDRSPTGIGRYAVDLLRSLIRTANDAEIVILSTEKSDPFHLRDLCEFHTISGCSTLPSILSIGGLKLRSIASRINLDAIHDPNGVAPFHGLPGSVRSVVTLHDAFAFIYPEHHNRLDTWRYRWHLPYAVRKSDAVITVSKCSQRDLVKHLSLDPNKVSVIHEGVHPRYSPEGDELQDSRALAKYGVRPPYLLYVGGLNDRKNVARLLQSFDSLSDDHPGVQLVIAGKRQWKTQSIEQAFKSLSARTSVHFTGYLDDNDLPAVYRAATALVFPSLYEGFGLPPLEAMACGTPAIVSNRSSLPEVTGDAALLIDPYDTVGLTRQMDRILRDGALRESLRAHGLKRASQFNWDDAALQTLKVYETVVQGTNLRVDSETAPEMEYQIRAN
jgi:glycosyltransferase involved in cell wall biosynthesis